MKSCHECMECGQLTLVVYAPTEEHVFCERCFGEWKDRMEAKADMEYQRQKEEGV